MKALRFLIACILLCSVVPVSAQETMDATTLHQHLLMAEGKPPDSYRVEEKTTSTAGDYSWVEFHRDADYKVVWDSALLHGEHGRFEGHIWDYRNRLTTLHELAAGNERPMPTTVTVERVTKPFEAWKETTLNPLGFGRVRYVDPTTFRVVRVESYTRYGTITTDYDDFRTLNGYTQPYHWKTDNEVNKITSETHVVSLDVRDVGDADLAIPASMPFLSFPADKTSVELPARFLFGEIVVRVMVGDRGLDFVFNSGSPGIFIHGEVAKQLGLKMSVGYSSADGYETREAVVPEMRVGDLTMRNIVVGTIPFAHDFGPLTVEKTETVGVIGYDFIRSIGLTIDFEHRKVTAFRAGSYTPPLMTPDSDILPIRIGSHVPEITATINGAAAEHVAVDTGAGAGLTIFDYFALRYPEAVRGRVGVRPGNIPLESQGARGGVESKALRVQQLDIDRYHMANILVMRVVSLRRFQPNVDGLLGREFLERFTVGFDYAGGKMYLVHNPGQ